VSHQAGVGRQLSERHQQHDLRGEQQAEGASRRRQPARTVSPGQEQADW